MRRAGEGRDSQRAALRFIHAELARRFLQRFDEIEHIRRTAARDRGDRVDLRFVVEPDGFADGAQHLRRERAACFVDAAGRDEARHTHTDQRRRVRHHAHDAGMAVQPARHVVHANTRDDADRQLGRLQMRRQRLGDALQDLRLHRQHDGVVRRERGVRGRAGLDAELLLIALARLFIGVDRVQVGGRDAALDEAADQRGSHIATADKSNFHDVPKEVT